MTDSADFLNRGYNAELIINEGCKNELKSLRMSRDVCCNLVILSSGNLELESGVSAYFLADTLCDNRLVIHIHELKLK